MNDWLWMTLSKNHRHQLDAWHMGIFTSWPQISLSIEGVQLLWSNIWRYCERGPVALCWKDVEDRPCIAAELAVPVLTMCLKYWCSERLYFFSTAVRWELYQSLDMSFEEGRWNRTGGGVVIALSLKKTTTYTYMDRIILTELWV